MRPVTAAPMSAAELVTDLAETYWELTLELRPLLATSVGDRRHDDRLPDASPGGRADARRRLGSLRDRAEAIDPASLDATDRITLSALREELAADLVALDSGLDEWTVDPLDGVPSVLLSLPDYQRVEIPEDGARMVSRWRAMGPFVDAHVENLRRGLANGRVASRSPVARVVDLLATLLATRIETWPLLKPAGRVSELQGWTDVERARFADELHAAVEADVRPALERLHGTLVDELLPAARGDDRPGIGHLDGGVGIYSSLVHRHTSLDLTPEELHSIGLAEIARIDDELLALTSRVLGTSRLEDALVRLRADPALHFSTRDEVEAAAVRSLERANEAVPGWFGRLPRSACVVTRMGSHEEAHSTIAYYREPSADGTRPGQYLINTSAPETRPRYEAEVLAFHEAVPGHHLQIALAHELDDLPTFRRHLGPTSYFEGWGLYIERLCDEIGLYESDLDRIGVLSYDAWRAGRLVVDTGMHALGWTRDQAIAFMSQHSALATNNIANEIDRYTVWPGQALAYKVGQLELLRLRAEARDALGARFDIRGFHDAVLGDGALPLTTLGTVVRAWTDAAAV